MISYSVFNLSLIKPLNQIKAQLMLHEIARYEVKERQNWH